MNCKINANDQIFKIDIDRYLKHYCIIETKI